MEPAEWIAFGTLIAGLVGSALVGSWRLSRVLTKLTIHVAGLQDDAKNLHESVKAHTDALNNGIRSEIREHTARLAELKRQVDELRSIRRLGDGQ